jgi:hypothetical protein
MEQSTVLKLVSSDQQEVEVSRSIAEMSVTIKNMLEGKKKLNNKYN